MQITVNGETRQCATGTALSQLMQELELTGSRAAVERNGEIVPRSKYPEVQLESGDRIEIVRFIGGG